nr:CYP370C6 protein [Diaphanosoma celebensis]
MLVTCLLIVVLGYCVYRATARPRNFPPGPLNLPVVGYLPFLDRHVHHQMTKLSEKYGDIFGLNFGSFTVVMLNSLGSVRDAFKVDTFSGRPDFPFFLIRSDNKKGVAFSEGQNWQDVRRFALRNLRDFGVGKSTIEVLVQDEIRELMASLEATAGSPTALQNRFNLAVVNALWTITTGERFSHDDPLALESAKNIANVLSSDSNSDAAEFMPFLSKFGPWRKKIDERLEQLSPVYQIIMGAIDNHREAHRDGDESDLMHAFIERINNSGADDASFNGTTGILNLKNLILDLFVAGTETTSTSLMWLILLLASHPEVQEKVQREIDTHVPRGTLPSMEHRLKLNYTEATIKESMRFASLVPMGLFHSATADTEFRGYTIPKGTILFANLHKIHHSPEYWEKPDEFYPEHFLDDDGLLTNPEAFIPFSTGKRSCLGESLAKMELFLFTAALFQKFTFKFPADRAPPSLVPNGGMVLSPKPFEVIVELRK